MHRPVPSGGAFFVFVAGRRTTNGRRPAATDDVRLTALALRPATVGRPLGHQPRDRGSDTKSRARKKQESGYKKGRNPSRSSSLVVSPAMERVSPIGAYFARMAVRTSSLSRRTG